MKFVSSLLLLSIAAQSVPAAALAQPFSAEDQYASTTPLSESEYADLKAYLNRAREALEETLLSAQTLGGPALHARLIAGIRSALEQSTSPYAAANDARNERLLFRNVLERALQVDSIFRKSIASTPNDDVLTSSSTIVLIASIRAALSYYVTSDLPRFESKLVPSPDWAGFVLDLIPAWLNMAGIAPSQLAKRDTLLAAISWVQTDLNRSINRREYAKIIVGLGQVYKDLEHGIRSMPEAQQYIKQAHTDLATAVKATASDKPTEFPTSMYPANLAPAGSRPTLHDNDGIFPLIEMSSVRGVDDFNLDLGPLSSDRTTHLTPNQLAHFVQLGGGAGYAHIDGKGDTFAALSARANLVYLPSYRVADGGINSMMQVFAEGQVSAAVTKGEVPIYNFKFQGGAGPAPAVNFYVAVEGSQWDKVSNYVARFGYSPMFTFTVDDTAYVMVRGFYGVGTMKNGPYGDITSDSGTKYLANDWTGTLNAGGQILLRISRFALNVEFTRDWGRDKAAPRVTRDQLTAMLAIPLGLIFPNDGLRIEGEFTRFTGDHADFKEYKIFKAGGYYEVRF